MKKKRLRKRKILAYSLPFLSSVGLLWYALEKVSLVQIGRQFQEANYFWLSLSLALGVISNWARAQRWAIVLQAMGYRVSIWQATVAVFAGYFFNFLVPRAGEVARCTVVQRSSQVPIAVSVGTIITERILDVLILFVLIGVLLLAEVGNMTALVWRFLEQKIPQWISYNFYFWVVMSVILIGGLLCVGLVWYWVRQPNHVIGQRLKRIGAGIWQGVISLKDVKRKGEFIFYSIFIWVLYYLMGYVLFFCFPSTAHLDMWFAYIILIIGTIGMSAPVQGGAGAYHLLVGNLFALRNLTVEEGVLLATFMHATQSIMVLVLGGTAFFYSIWTSSKNLPEATENGNGIGNK